MSDEGNSDRRGLRSAIAGLQDSEGRPPNSAPRSRESVVQTVPSVTLND